MNYVTQFNLSIPKLKVSKLLLYYLLNLTFITRYTFSKFNILKPLKLTFKVCATKPRTYIYLSYFNLHCKLNFNYLV